MENFRSGFVSIVGRTNVGKSSILNEMVGQKVAVVANKPHAIRGFLSTPDTQDAPSPSRLPYPSGYFLQTHAVSAARSDGLSSALLN